MPIFEFYCPENHKLYAFFARSPGLADRVPRCPDNPSFTLRKEISPFALVGRARDPVTASPEADLSDPRTEALMQEMQQEMGALEEENPDPRRLGRLLRRMAEATGERVPERMQDLLRRLEAGEDPESLEHEFGDDLEPDPEPEEPALGPPANAASWARRWRPPERDPTLYEMSEFL